MLGLQIRIFKRLQKSIILYMKNNIVIQIYFSILGNVESCHFFTKFALIRISCILMFFAPAPTAFMTSQGETHIHFRVKYPPWSIMSTYLWKCRIIHYKLTSWFYIPSSVENWDVENKTHHKRGPDLQHKMKLVLWSHMTCIGCWINSKHVQ